MGLFMYALWATLLVAEVAAAISVALHGLPHWLTRQRRPEELLGLFLILSVAITFSAAPLVAAMFWAGRRFEEWRWARLAHREKRRRK
jgi:hypothetical protein